MNLRVVCGEDPSNYDIHGLTGLATVCLDMWCQKIESSDAYVRLIQQKPMDITVALLTPLVRVVRLISPYLVCLKNELN